MPQIQRTDASKRELVNTENIPLRQRLMELFKARDFVLVKNIDDEAYQWQYMPSDGEDTWEDVDHTRVTTGRPEFNSDYSAMTGGNEQFWEIAPGETEVLLGENAYVFIEGLYKRVAAKRMIKRTKNQPSTVARSFNWSDPGTQKEIIDEIFRGVQTPKFGKNDNASGRTANAAA